MIFSKSIHLLPRWCHRVALTSVIQPQFTCSLVSKKQKLIVELFSSRTSLLLLPANSTFISTYSYRGRLRDPTRNHPKKMFEKARAHRLDEYGGIIHFFLFRVKYLLWMFFKHVRNSIKWSGVCVRLTIVNVFVCKLKKITSFIEFTSEMYWEKKEKFLLSIINQHRHIDRFYFILFCLHFHLSLFKFSYFPSLGAFNYFLSFSRIFVYLSLSFPPFRFLFFRDAFEDFIENRLKFWSRGEDEKYFENSGEHS